MKTRHDPFLASYAMLKVIEEEEREAAPGYAAGAPKYWKVPPEIYAALSSENGPFDFDPCPCPRPEGYDSLIIPWGMCNFVNPPFRKHDGVNGKGPTAFVRKAIAEQAAGKSSVLILPVQSYVNLLLEAGAELRSLGRLRWREATTGEQMPNPTPICCFVLRPKTNGVTAQTNEADTARLDWMQEFGEPAGFFFDTHRSEWRDDRGDCAVTLRAAIDAARKAPAS